MNYLRIYNELMHNAKHRPKPIGYCEKHHVLPKAMGGNNAKHNLVFLTAKEHYIAHLLLAKIAKGKQRIAMANALCMMMKSGRYATNFVLARKLASNTKANLQWFTKDGHDVHCLPEQAPIGYTRGRHRNSHSWYNNGIAEKQLPIGEVPDGWVKGRLASHMAKSAKSKYGIKYKQRKNKLIG